MLDIGQFAVDLLGAAGLFVSLRLLQFGGEFGLPRFERLDFLFQLMNRLLLCLALARTRLPLFRLQPFLFLAVQPAGGSRIAARC